MTISSKAKHKCTSECSCQTWTINIATKSNQVSGHALLHGLHCPHQGKLALSNVYNLHYAGKRGHLSLLLLLWLSRAHCMLRWPCAHGSSTLQSGYPGCRQTGGTVAIWEGLFWYWRIIG